MKQDLLRLADKLDELACVGDSDYDFSELGDWFYTWGSEGVLNVANELRELSKKANS